MSGFDLKITSIHGIGEKRAKLFAGLGIETAGDLLRFYPRAYRDFSSPIPIAQCPAGELCCILAMAASPVRTVLVRRGMTLYKLRTEDDSGACELTFFNNRYIPSLIKTGERYFFYGRMEGTFLRREMSSPEFEPYQSASILPVYSAVSGLSSRNIRSAVKGALELLNEPDDPIPDDVRQKYGLCHLRFALENIHFPQSSEALQTARRRLIFEELLSLQLGMLHLRGRSKSVTGAVCKKSPDFTRFYSALPFRPTGAQLRAIDEAAGDMRKTQPMNRLVEGDVGSGKTLVAAALFFYAAQNGFQSAFMAPTEILAAQHYKTVCSLLEGSGIRIGLLTGSLPASEKRRVQGLLETGGLDLAVGTHALLSDTVAFSCLGLVVTDEQHRFGVAQRARLSSKGTSPHMLIMSATPIPRTLALMIYGDLDISILDELPAGRRPVRTYCVDSSKRKRMYAFIRNLLDQGRQAYIVCPRIESDESGTTAAEEYAGEIASGEFSGYRIGMLHGRLKANEKEQIMSDFAEGKLQLLVSTTVIEVGVDVPNAVVMVVENAERFGLSQLHQLRGRVGRGAAQSYCILISDARSPETERRLNVMARTSDGFQIAEKDLELRGPGDFFGSRQHGLPALRIADLAQDSDILKKARECALNLLAQSPGLSKPEFAGLRRMVTDLFEDEAIIFN